MTERVRKVVPEPVLDVVHEGEEDRCRQRSRNANEGAEGDEAQVRARTDLRLVGHGSPAMLSRILRPMNISKWFRRQKPTDEDLREQEENRLRAAEETRRAEQDSERSRGQSKVPGAGHDSGIGPIGGGF
jgi:hypothetical protein